MNNELISKNKYIIIAVVLIFGISAGILGYLKYNIKASPTLTPSIFPAVTISPSISPISNITPPPEVWETYTNSQLGFSIKYPQMVYGVSRCSSNNPFYVPVKVFYNSENGIIYITEEYYYDNGSTKIQDNTGICKKIDYSLESLKNEDKNVIFPDGTYYSGWKPPLGWKIIISNIKNNIELNKFIKDNYGTGCLAESKKDWSLQAGVYEIKLNAFKDANGKDTDLGSTVCPVNYAYKILYDTKRGKTVSVKLGQECTFGTDFNSQSYKCYDEEMINSFRFE